MNQTQRNYLKDRVNSLRNQKCYEIREKHTTDGVRLTNKQRYAALKDGTAKLRPWKEMGSTDRGRSALSLGECFVFPGERRQFFDAKKANAEVEKLDREVTALVDEIMVGDEPTALKMLRDFEKKHASKS